MREKELAKMLNIEKEKIKCIVANADGDCFYQCMSIVLNLSTQELRNIVSQNFTEDIYQTYKAICDYADDLIWIRRCKSIDEAKELLAIPKLVWADEFTLKVFVQYFDMTLYIINEGKGRGSTHSFNKVGNGNQHHIILNRTRREHYNLIYFNSDNEEETSAFYNQFMNQNI